MKGYSGSIAASEGAIALTSAPAGVVMFFDRMGQHRATFQRADISGASANGMGFMASDGHGAIWACGPQDMQLLSQKATLWDNHLMALTCHSPPTRQGLQHQTASGPPPWYWGRRALKVA